jgi:hypothetical protein
MIKLWFELEDGSGVRALGFALDAKELGHRPTEAEFNRCFEVMREQAIAALRAIRECPHCHHMTLHHNVEAPGLPEAADRFCTQCQYPGGEP